jgi:hypothetical protein
MTLTGQVEEGVEPGCLVLRHNGELYQLVGGDKSVVRAGARVTVRGSPVDMMSTCMQGKPFQVVEAHPA